MKKANVQSVVILSQSRGTTGPQIVLPFFRPISIYEIEDSYEELVEEIKAEASEDIHKELLSFLDAFKASLEQKTADPLFEYFIFNHGPNLDNNQISEVFDALDGFIEEATDMSRPMH